MQGRIGAVQPHTPILITTSKRSVTMINKNMYDRYENAVASMNIPPLRKLASTANASWFIRNAWIGNKNHSNYIKARELAIKIANSH